MENIENKENGWKGWKYCIPKCKSRFAYTINALHSNERITECTEWWYECSRLDKNEFTKRVGDTSAFPSYLYPFCHDLDKFVLVHKYFMHLFIWDDHTEALYGEIGRNSEASRRIWAQYGEVLDRLVDEKRDKPMEKWKPYSLATYATLESIFKSLNSVQKKRLEKSLRRFMNASIDETEVQSNTNRITCFDDIMDVRLGAGAMEACFILLEYAYDIYIPEDEWTDTKFQKILTLANKATILLNDIYSFEKESKEQGDVLERLIINAVAYNAITHKINVAEAMDIVVEWIKDVEQDLYDLSEEMLNDCNISEAIKTFIRGVLYMIGGNYKVSTVTTRYNKI